MKKSTKNLYLISKVINYESDQSGYWSMSLISITSSKSSSITSIPLRSISVFIRVLQGNFERNLLKLFRKLIPKGFKESGYMTSHVDTKAKASKGVHISEQGYLITSSGE